MKTLRYLLALLVLTVALPAFAQAGLLGGTTGVAISPSTVTVSGSAPQFVCSSASAVCELDSATGNAVTSGTVAAFVFKQTAAITGTDLVFEFQNSSAGRIFAGDANGSTYINGQFNGPTTSQMLLVSNAPDSAASNTSPALVARASTNVTDGDQIFGVQNAVPANVFLVDEQGVVTLPAMAGTAGSGTGITVNYTAALQRFVHKITIAETALTGAATTEDETIWTLPAKTKVTRMIADVTQVFAGGTITDFDVTCGTSAGGNQFLVTFDIDTAIGTYGDAEAELGTGLAGGIGSVNWGGTTVVQCRFTSVGGNVVAATTGSMTLYIEGVLYP